MSGYVSKADILQMLSDIENELSRAEQCLNHSLKLYETEMKEMEGERLSVIEEELHDLHTCLQELSQTKKEKLTFEKAYHIS
ncbi:hypothetical protein C6370_15105 [Bacillus atrophaeus]|uniref:DUF5446 family protein n=1 Tax=Bacillus atrophaeus TaxID=1452 RepID=UPI000D051593|nr:DUF5446 family protein [Bacillus atrophaeus]MED1123189.1 DUF5446 family protein [Bacillus atrophaeus]PSA93304.1 hypothetical protein C6370_15105 [Bacillus atrophaeus]